MGFPGSSDSKESACNGGDLASIPSGRPLEKGMATHSSILAWKIPMDRQRSLAGYIQSTGHKDSDVTEQFKLSLSLFMKMRVESGVPWWSPG